jgi:hypothetical protein
MQLGPSINHPNTNVLQSADSLFFFDFEATYGLSALNQMAELLYTNQFDLSCVVGFNG